MRFATDAYLKPRLRQIGKIIDAISNHRPMPMIKLRIEGKRRENEFAPIYVGW